jgi:beta-lactamase superfamily II metal-dependent hydrolase
MMAGPPGWQPSTTPSPAPSPAQLPQLQVHFADIGQGDAILIVSPEGRAILIDGGEAGSGVLAYLGQELEATILKVAHHGSSTSSTPSFLAAVRPEVAIYSCATGNVYGHPYAPALAALGRLGAQVYGTEDLGTIVVATDGYRYSVTAMGPGATPGRVCKPAGRAPTPGARPGIGSASGVPAAWEPPRLVCEQTLGQAASVRPEATPRGIAPWPQPAAVAPGH